MTTAPSSTSWRSLRSRSLSPTALLLDYGVGVLAAPGGLFDGCRIAGRLLDGERSALGRAFGGEGQEIVVRVAGPKDLARDELRFHGDAPAHARGAAALEG